MVHRYLTIAWNHSMVSMILSNVASGTNPGLFSTINIPSFFSTPRLAHYCPTTLYQLRIWSLLRVRVLQSMNTYICTLWAAGTVWCQSERKRREGRETEERGCWKSTFYGLHVHNACTWIPQPLGDLNFLPCLCCKAETNLDTVSHDASRHNDKQNNGLNFRPIESASRPAKRWC
jgi:hypothetical protein